MFALVHDMRTRILTADAFSSERIIGAILFEDTVCLAFKDVNPQAPVRPLSV